MCLQEGAMFQKPRLSSEKIIDIFQLWAHPVKGCIRNLQVYGSHEKCESQMIQQIVSACFLRRRLNFMSSVEWGLTAFPGVQHIFVNTEVRDKYSSFIHDICMTEIFSYVPGTEKIWKVQRNPSMTYGEASQGTPRPQTFKSMKWQEKQFPLPTWSNGCGTF